MTLRTKRIEELLSQVQVRGTGFIPTDEKNWWFAVGNEKYWRKTTQGTPQISFTCIGGHVEPGESFIDATLREVKEETGSDAILQNSKKTFFVISELEDEVDKFDFKIKSIEEIKVIDQPVPYIIYIARRKYDTLGVVTYKGEFVTEPYPQMEVPALLCLTPELLDQKPKTIAELFLSGAKIREQQIKIPRNAIMYPFGSATIIQSIVKKKKSN